MSTGARSKSFQAHDTDVLPLQPAPGARTKIVVVFVLAVAVAVATLHDLPGETVRAVLLVALAALWAPALCSGPTGALVFTFAVIGGLVTGGDVLFFTIGAFAVIWMIWMLPAAAAVLWALWALTAPPRSDAPAGVGDASE